MAHFVESPLSINCRVAPGPSEKSIEIRCTRLDEALAEYGVSKVDILKIDTEGHERAVLSGATGTLARVARIVVELHGDLDHEARLDRGHAAACWFRGVGAARTGRLLRAESKGRIDGQRISHCYLDSEVERRMVVLEQTLFGFLRYRKVFFPTPEDVNSLTAKLAVNDVLRFQCDTRRAFNSPYLVQRFPVSSVCIDLTQDVDVILKGMDRRTARYLRAAEKLPGQIEVKTNTEAVVEHYLEVYNAFARAKGRVPKLSRRLLDLYRPVSDIFVLYFERRPMCAHLTVRDESTKRLYSMFGGNRRLESKADADLCGKLERHLFWHEIRSYQARGMELYSLGGIAHEDLSAPFNQFKLRFGGTVLTEESYTFAGVPAIARFGLAAYKRLRNSKAAKAVGRV